MSLFPVPTFICTACKEPKEIRFFNLRRDGRPTTQCKLCQRKRCREATQRYRKGKRPEIVPDPTSRKFTCIRCKKTMGEEYFNKNAARYRGCDNRCKECAAKEVFDRRLRFQFGISEDDYNRMLKKQKNLCFICRKPESVVHMGKTPRLSVDHCHKTNKVRGLLCYACNHLIGFLERHGKVQVEKAWRYIADHSS